MPLATEPAGGECIPEPPVCTCPRFSLPRIPRMGFGRDRPYVGVQHTYYTSGFPSTHRLLRHPRPRPLALSLPAWYGRPLFLLAAVVFYRRITPGIRRWRILGSEGIIRKSLEDSILSLLLSRAATRTRGLAARRLPNARGEDNVGRRSTRVVLPADILTVNHQK